MGSRSLASIASLCRLFGGHLASTWATLTFDSRRSCGLEVLGERHSWRIWDGRLTR
jgi:hypothetical protein